MSAMELAARCALQIPVSSVGNGKATLITIYPNELPQIMSSGDNEIKAVLERELAPLPVWHNCAVSRFPRKRLEYKPHFISNTLAPNLSNFSSLHFIARASRRNSAKRSRS